MEQRSQVWTAVKAHSREEWGERVHVLPSFALGSGCERLRKIPFCTSVFKSKECACRRLVREFQCQFTMISRYLTERNTLPKTIPYLRNEQLIYHTLFRGRYLFSLPIGASPPPPLHPPRPLQHETRTQSWPMQKTHVRINYRYVSKLKKEDKLKLMDILEK